MGELIFWKQQLAIAIVFANSNNDISGSYTVGWLAFLPSQTFCL